jgi:preprotein translocase subunit SecA
MTGTAETEAAEFEKIYNLEVVVIPTNKPVIRIDHDDLVYRTKREKYNAILEETKRFFRKVEQCLSERHPLKFQKYV